MINISTIEEYNEKLQELIDEEKRHKEMGINTLEITKSINALKRLYKNLILTRASQSKYQVPQYKKIKWHKYVFLNTHKYKKPNIFDRIIHLIRFHYWLDYDDPRVFDCARRICLLCGYTVSTPMKRRFGYDRANNNGALLDLNKLNQYLKRFD